jgi:hypothetical protein
MCDGETKTWYGIITGANSVVLNSLREPNRARVPIAARSGGAGSCATANENPTPGAREIEQISMRVPEQAGGQAGRRYANAQTGRQAGNRRRGDERCSLVLEHKPLLDGVHPSVFDHRGGHPNLSFSARVGRAEEERDATAKAFAAAARVCGLR